MIFTAEQEAATPACQRQTRKLISRQKTGWWHTPNVAARLPWEGDDLRPAWKPVRGRVTHELLNEKASSAVDQTLQLAQCWGHHVLEEDIARVSIPASL